MLRLVVTSHATQAAGAHEQGVVLGLTQSLSSISLVVAPMIGTALIEHSKLTAWALVAAGSVTVGLLVAGRERARREPEPEPEEAGRAR